MTIPASLFGLTTQRIASSHFPSVPFDSFRIWDIDGFNAGGTTWAGIETSSGVYNFSGLDVWLTACKNNNKTVLYTFGFVPAWANGNQLPGVPPSDIATGNTQWKNFVTKLVQHSLAAPASGKAKISYYEIWNEPDLQTYWQGSPAQMVTMAHDAYTIIKALDPSAIVIGPSPSTATSSGVHFLPSYYAANGFPYQDIIGCHAYLYNGSVFATTPVGITTTINQLKKLATTYGIGNQRIWFTEGTWGGSPNNTNMTMDQKVAYLGQDYMLMVNSAAVDRFYWYSWDNTDWGTMWTVADGVLPTGTAYAILNGWLVGSTITSTLPVAQGGDGIYAISLNLPSGDPAQIVWNPTTTKSFSTSFTKFFNLDSFAQHNVSGGVVSIGAKPIMLTGSVPPVTATPNIVPGTGTYTSAQTVTITDATPSSSIFYTIDGSPATPSSTPYTGPFLVSVTTTVNAVATASGFSTSLQASQTYTITAPPLTPAATPQISPSTGTYTVAQTVTITDTTPGSSIFYALNGPASPSSTLYTGPFVVGATTVVNAVATASGFSTSDQATAILTIQPTPPPPSVPTTGCIFWGQFISSSLDQAFNNPLNLDILQVINRSGRIVWNLDSGGTSNDNPINPSKGSVLGPFSGASFTLAMSPNPLSLDVFQIVTPGEQVIFGVTSTGTTYSFPS